MNYTFRGASATGREHLQDPTLPEFGNCQDARYQSPSDFAPTAPHYNMMVADGCGNPNLAPNSHIGSYMGVQIAADVATGRYEAFVESEGPDGLNETTMKDFFEKVRLETVDRIHEIAKMMAKSKGTNVMRVLDQSFMFTLNAALFVPNGAYLYRVGDGIRVVNGKVQILETAIAGPENKPAYLMYEVTRPSEFKELEHLYRFDTEFVPSDQIDSIVLGTDGAVQWHQFQSNVKFPGTGRSVTPFSSIWTDQKFRSDPTLLLRTLRLMQVYADGDLALLDDDVAIQVAYGGRR